MDEEAFLYTGYKIDEHQGPPSTLHPSTHLSILPSINPSICYIDMLFPYLARSVFISFIFVCQLCVLLSFLFFVWILTQNSNLAAAADTKINGFHISSPLMPFGLSLFHKHAHIISMRKQKLRTEQNFTPDYKSEL